MECVFRVVVELSEQLDPRIPLSQVTDSHISALTVKVKKNASSYRASKLSMMLYDVGQNSNSYE